MATAVRTLEQLRRALVAHASGEGRTATAYPGLWIAQATAPIVDKRVEARMVTLAVILRGTKRVEFGSQSLSYGPGDYLLITGEQRYRASIPGASPATPYASLSLEFSPEALAQSILALADAGDERPHQDGGAPGGPQPSGASDPPGAVGQLESELLDPLVRLAECLDDPVATRVLAPLAERELLLRLLRSGAGVALRRAAAGDDGRILRARMFLRERLDQRLSVRDVAQHVAMSPSHFAHRFREVVRMSPMLYLKHLRLDRARTLMVGQGLGAAQAGLSVGYASASHFTRDFKAHFGAAPTRYVRGVQPSRPDF